MSIKLKDYNNIEGEVDSYYFTDYSVIDEYNCTDCLIYTSKAGISYSFKAYYNIKPGSTLDVEWAKKNHWVTTEKEVNKMIRQIMLRGFKRYLKRHIKLLKKNSYWRLNSIINNLMVILVAILASIQVVLSYPFVTIINLIKKNK